MRETELQEIGKKGFDLLRDLLMEEFPYLAVMILAMPGEADMQEEGMSTDGEKIFYNPRYVAEHLGKKRKGYEKLRRVYFQMLIHCLLGHVWQIPEENVEIWDCCCDLEAETLLGDILGRRDEEGHSSIDWKLEELLRKMEVLDVESLYTLLSEEEYEILGYRVGKKLKKDGHERWRTKAERTGNEERSKQNDPKGWGTKERMGDRNALGQGIPQMWRDLYEQVLPMMPSISAFGGRYGRHRGGAAADICASGENESDYRKILKKYTILKECRMEDFEALDYSWYSFGMELYGNIPLIEYPESSEQRFVDEIVIAVDTSGSCSGYTAQRFLRETCNMIRDMGIGRRPVNIRIIECDENVQNEIVIHGSSDIPDLEQRVVSGFGGTSFVPVFNRIEELKKNGEMNRVRCLLYLSDGIGIFPVEKPDYDVIFVLTSRLPENFGYDEYMDLPDWVRSVYLTERDLEEDMRR